MLLAKKEKVQMPYYVNIIVDDFGNIKTQLQHLIRPSLFLILYLGGQ